MSASFDVSTAPAPSVQATPARRTRERKRALMQALRRVLLAVLVLAAAVATTFALRPRPVPIDRAVARRGPLVSAIDESGTTRIKDRFEVSAPVTGSRRRIAFEPGDQIAEGDVLAQITPLSSPLLDERARAETEARLGAALSAEGQAQALSSRAEAAEQLARREIERLRSLVRSGAATAQELEEADFNLRMRAEELASAEYAAKVAIQEARLVRITLDRGRGRPRDRHVDVLAPSSGQILRIEQKSAGVVQAGTPLLEVGDPSALEIVVDVLTTDAVLIRPGTEVAITGWGGNGALGGRVRRVEPAAFMRPSALGVDEQRVNVVITMTAPRDKWLGLGDGYRVEVRFILWQTGDALKVPEGAVFRRGDGFAVFRVEDGVARLTPVTIGHRGDAEVEVVSGLSAGTAVAVHPGDRVRDGARVEPR
jgi:HlyD family secretion protein